MQNNVKCSLEKGELVIRIKADAKAMAAAPLSSTGKTRLLGSTGGAVPVPGSPIKVALNVMIPATA